MIIAHRLFRRFTRLTMQTVGQVIPVGEQKIFPDGTGGNFRFPFPDDALFAGQNFTEEPQRSKPQRLNFHRIALTWRSGGIIGIHPGEMARTENQHGFRIGFDSVRSSGDEIGSDFLELVENGFSGTDFGFEEVVGTFGLAEVFDGGEEPELCVARVAVADSVAMDDVRDRALICEHGELADDGFDVVAEFPCRDESARRNERVASPVEEPRIAGDDGFEIAAFDDECAHGVEHIRFDP